MYPTLAYLLEDLFGVSINLPFPTFGFMVAMAFITAAALLTVEFKRLEALGAIEGHYRKVLKGAPATIGEMAGQGVLGFIIGWKLIGLFLNYSLFSQNPQNYVLSGEGSIIAGVLFGGLAVYLKYREKQKELLPEPKMEDVWTHPHELVGDITVYAMIAGIAGAKIFHYLEKPEDFHGIVDAIISMGGLTWYGGLILAAIVILWFTSKKGIPIPRMLDISAPALMLGYAVGRVGCQLAGDGDWGIPNLAVKPDSLSFLPDWMWSYTYPHNVINEGVMIVGCAGQYCAELAQPVWPTPLYEIIMCTLAFGIIWVLRSRLNTAGMLFGVYLILTGIERFAIEKIRDNAHIDVFGFSMHQAELISSIMILLGIGGIVYLYRKK